MSDPSIQTFCCHKPGIETLSLSIMSEFNSTSYNVVCLISSVIGIVGAIYQMLPREGTSSQRWFSLTSMRGRQIVVWLALADLLASLGVFMRSVVKLNDSVLMVFDDNETIIFCVIMAAWIEYFYSVTWLWTLFYAVDMWRALRQKPAQMMIYHGITWCLPAVLTMTGLSILYLPNADCHNLGSDSATFLRLLPNYFITYIPIATVMFANPVLYVLSSNSIHNIVANCLSQFTRKERAVVDAVRLRFGFINLAFYACWLPNLINGVVIWASWYNPPRLTLLSLWYIMAVMNPLQALFNSIVYTRSNQRIVFPFSTIDETTPLVTANINN
ncbi:hypothetical protein AAG570_010302 [Ranatra chinensis]|uniref:Uncharacterized protein n=1 Tax=Ranatra chinensis TaxID=642074 RepID=A0ABD0YM52_9HEMI